MNERRPEYRSQLALRLSGVALLAGALLFLVSATQAGAGCNPPGQTRTEIEDFTVKDTVSGNVATSTAAASPNPGTLAICDDGTGTATIEMSATTSMGDKKYIGWRIEKATGGASDLIADGSTGHADPNEGKVDSTTASDIQSTLTVTNGTEIVREFYVKAFCDGGATTNSANGKKDADEDYYSDINGAVIELKVVVLKVELMEVSFGGSGEHTLKKTGGDTWTNDTYVSEGDTTITDPIWKDANLDGDGEDAGDTDNPVCFTRESSPTIQAKFKVSPSLTLSAVPFTATLHAGPTVTLNYSTNANVSGSEVSVTFATTDQLPDQVFNGTWTVDFACDIAGLTGVDPGSSEHKAFVTYDTPKTEYFDIDYSSYPTVPMALTARRVDKATDWADGESTTNGIATACNEATSFLLGPYTNNPFAALDAGGSWDCISCANISATACRLLGLPAHPYRAYCTPAIATNDSTTWGWAKVYHLYHKPSSGEESWFHAWTDNNFEGFFFVGDLDVSSGVFPATGWFRSPPPVSVTASAGKEKYLSVSILAYCGVTSLEFHRNAGGVGWYVEWKPGNGISGASMQQWPSSWMDTPANDGTYDVLWNATNKTLKLHDGTPVGITSNGEYTLPCSIGDLKVDVTTNSLPTTDATGKARVVLPHDLAPVP